MAETMPDKFGPLAAYNAERARGIVHTPEWDAHMAKLQAEFNHGQQSSDEDRIRDAMAEAQDHPGRIVTR